MQNFRQILFKIHATRNKINAEENPSLGTYLAHHPKYRILEWHCLMIICPHFSHNVRSILLFYDRHVKLIYGPYVSKVKYIKSDFKL